MKQRIDKTVSMHERVEMNLPLVAECIGDIIKGLEDIDDMDEFGGIMDGLISIGTIGLMKGLNANEQYNDGVTVNLKAYIKKEIRDYMIKVAN